MYHPNAHMRSEESMGHIPSHYGSQPKTTTNGQTTTGPQISITRRDDGKYFIGFLLPSACLHYCCRRGALRPREREKRGKFCKFCYIRHLNAERGPHPRTVECSTFLRSWSSSSTSKSPSPGDADGWTHWKWLAMLAKAHLR